MPAFISTILLPVRLSTMLYILKIILKRKTGPWQKSFEKQLMA
jgi:hypothetical protein